jgi:hypothetical protein
MTSLGTHISFVCNLVAWDASYTPAQRNWAT